MPPSPNEKIIPCCGNMSLFKTEYRKGLLINPILLVFSFTSCFIVHMYINIYSVNGTVYGNFKIGCNPDLVHIYNSALGSLRLKGSLWLEASLGYIVIPGQCGLQSRILCQDLNKY